MKIIDRYILRQFIRTFLICFLSLTGLYVVFDVFGHLEEFMRYGKQQGGIFSVIVPYYTYRSLFFFDQTAGLLALLSAMFTVTWIQRHNEMTALMAAGISRIRVALPVIVAAIVIALLSTANRELLIPHYRDQLSREPKDLLGSAACTLEPTRDLQTGIFLRGRSTFAKQKRISNPSFLLPLALQLYGKQLVAENGFYYPPKENRPGGYLLQELKQPSTLDNKPSLVLKGKPIVITPRDAPNWLKTGECFVVSNVAFEQLAGTRSWRRYASTVQLIRSIRNPSLDCGAKARVEIHSRLLHPLSDITLLFLGLPLVLSRESRNVFLAIGICILVVSIFMLVTMAFQWAAGSSYWITPALAAWAPLLLFVPLAAGMVQSVWE